MDNSTMALKDRNLDESDFSRYSNKLNYYEKQKSELFNFLEAFGNRERFLILDMLKKKDRCVCELETILQKTQPAVSHHLRILEKCNLIKSTRVGKFSHYSLVRSQFKKFQQMWKKWAEDITNWFGE